MTERKVRYIPVNTVHLDQLDHAKASDLYKVGDMVLVWVNEGDLIASGVQEPYQKNTKSWS